MTELRRSSRVASKTNSKAAAETKIESLKESKVSKPAKKVSKPEGEAKKEAKQESKDDPEESVEVNSKEIEVGDDIPDITLLNQDEKPLSLKELALNNKLIIIFAYPKASTPGCTRQACGFRDNFNSISDKALVLGLSADTPKAQKTFQTKQNLQYDLLADTKKELIGILGAKKSPSGIKRSHWIFKDGKLVVKRVQISPEVSIKEGKEKILELVE